MMMNLLEILTHEFGMMEDTLDEETVKQIKELCGVMDACLDDTDMGIVFYTNRRR